MLMRNGSRILLAGVLMASTKPQGPADTRALLNPKLHGYVQGLLPQLEALPEERKRELKRLALFVTEKVAAKESAKLLFICTHNSRRSHMGQLWSAAAAAFYGIPNVETFSGGTEVTAFNPRAVAAMQRAGFLITTGEGANFHHHVRFAESAPPVEAFSKKFADVPNPRSNFAAVMTCGQADQSCPIVAGASLRVPLHYEDPKVADNTPEEAATYDARSRQIATEMFYLFSQVKR
jgi:arsenate reductase